MNDIKIHRDKIGDLCIVRITSNKFNCKFDRIGNDSIFEFYGKIPSRRLVREIMKEIGGVIL